MMMQSVSVNKNRSVPLDISTGTSKKYPMRQCAQYASQSMLPVRSPTQMNNNEPQHKQEGKKASTILWYSSIYLLTLLKGQPSVRISLKERTLSMWWVEILANALLFFLVLGMSATVDFAHFKAQLNNRKAIIGGLCLQFLLLPLLGFLSVLTFRLDHPTGVALLVITSSPGGSYSNWWCSLFNADLALSVTLTAISTILSAIMLPINLLIYAGYLYKDNVNALIDWGALVLALVVVILAIALGLFSSAKYNSEYFKLLANRLGNAAGAILVFISFFMANTDADARIWDRDAAFYFSIIIPCLFSLIAGTVVGTGLKLCKPERLTLAIEVSYQNIGIATSMAIAMFEGDDRAAAMGVPFFYGVTEAVLAFIYCMAAWKSGWTKAPANVSFWHMLTTSYEVLESEEGGLLTSTEVADYYMVDASKDTLAERGTELVEAPPQSQVV
jgi:predicted Na+-dependent transporter